MAWEEVLARDPEVILIMDYTGGTPVTVEDKEAVLEERLGSGTAMQEGRVLALPLTGTFLGCMQPGHDRDTRRFPPPVTPVEARTPKRTVARRAPRGQASEEAPVLP